MKLQHIWRAHRARIIVLALLLVGGGYWVYGKSTAPVAQVKYVTAPVTRGTLTMSVTGTGQVAVTNQLDVKPKASGDVIRVAVANGQTVPAGAVLAQLDTREAQKTIRDAAASLESTQLSLAKLQQPADELSLLQAANAVTQAQQSKQSAQDALAKAYADGFTDVSSTFLDLPGIMAGLNSLLFDKNFDAAQWNVDWYVSQANVWEAGIKGDRDAVVAAYRDARQQYDAAFQVYQATSRSATSNVIGVLISQTTDTTQAVSGAIKAASNYLNHIQDLMSQHSYTVPSRMTSQQSTLNSYTGTVNGHLATLTSILDTIKNNTQNITNADQNIQEKIESLAKLKAGADPLDVKSQQLAVQQRENALLDAQEKLADYTVRAPFDGLVSNVDAKVGDAVSSGTTVATLITTQHLADISLNEVDVAKVALGQKVVLTFDAIEGLSLTGEVADIASLGTVSQGVVSYDVKISFDTQDNRIKPGMSVSASIITDVRQDVLLVPNSAVKTQGGSTYVQVLLNGALQRQSVEVGVSNDTSTEITSGVTEGTPVVTQTIDPSATSTSSSSTQRSGGSLIPGLGGGSFRIGGGR